MHTNSFSGRPHAFTLVELMVSTAILGLLLIVLVQMTNQTTKTWRYTTGKIEQFREARTAFETMTRRIGQATLNTYWDYQYAPGDTAKANPLAYGRQSDLFFVSGGMQHATGTTSTGAVPSLMPGTVPIRPTHGIFFQAPLGYVVSSSTISSANGNLSTNDYQELHGLDNLLNTWGYYVEVNDDAQTGQRPPIFTNPNSPPLRVRSRLMELMQPSNQLTVYNDTLPYILSPSANAALGVKFDWFTQAIQAGPSTATSVGGFHVLAENVIALIILPKLSKQDLQDPQNQTVLGSVPDAALAPNYYYNSAGTGQATITPLLNSKNQLPPVVQVTMVAVDESSISRLMSGADVSTSETQAQQLMATLGITGGTRFVDATKYESDLLMNPTVGAADKKCLEQVLIDNKIIYRIFTTNVSIRAAKWSRAEKN
jgi:uncharacterized protein (TIGR02599 family)